MPPMYDWKCKKCAAADAVVADVDQRDVPPVQSDGPKCNEGEHDWVRVIGAPKTTFGSNWSPDGRGNKGRW